MTTPTMLQHPATRATPEPGWYGVDPDDARLGGDPHPGRRVPARVPLAFRERVA